MVERQTKFQEMSNEELLLLYRETHDGDVKRELTMRYLYIVKKIAVQMKSVYGSFFQIEEIVDEGVIAIMKGLDRYEYKYDVKFEVFISKRIRGMILDMVREQDYMPRVLRKGVKQMEEIQMEVYQATGKMPDDEELQRRMELGKAKFLTVKKARESSGTLSLDQIAADSDNGMGIQIRDENINSYPEDLYLRKEKRNLMLQILNQLKENEQTVISLYYVEGLNMKEISGIMKISEPRVSQIHAKAIEKLRACFRKNNYFAGQKAVL